MGNDGAMRKELKLELTSDARLLGAVRGLIRGYLGSRGLERERIQEVVLAVDEACANAIRHSYGGQIGGAVTLTLRTDDEEWAEVCLEDHGEPVALERVARKTLEPPTLETAKPGGLGVQLMYAVFDEVEFRPGNETGNCVIMRLRLPQRKET
jgi:anti-sigma regulatory factor (Ser/Thr protein kinase)